MPSKLVAVDRQDVCNSCLHDLPAGTQAWWDATTNQLQCGGCHASGGTVERRATSRIARVAKFFNDSEPSNDGPERVEPERMLSLHLHTRLASRAVVFDDRKVPGTRCHIDHLVIAPSGVWVIDANEYDGRVERRDIGGWFKVDERLFIAGKDRTHLVDSIDRQVIAVENMLTKEGLDGVPVHAALCFVNSEWGWFAKPFSLNGVWVAWPDKLTQLMLDWNVMPSAEVDRLARVVGSRMPSAA